MLKHRVSNAGMGAGAAPVMRAPQATPEYCSTDNVVEQNEKVHTADAKDGIQRITEKYDSFGVGPGSPAKRSPARTSIIRESSSGFLFPETVTKFREGVTEQDLLQVDMFYRSHKTDVYVCGCLANVYIGNVKAAFGTDQWSFTCTGIPLLVLDTGDHLRQRRLHMVIAEKGTGFTLWKDVIDNLTGYKAPNPNFHTLHISTDHAKVAGFSFDDAGSAAEFLSHLLKLTADPNDELLKIGKSKQKKKSVKEKKKKVKLPKKTEISQPCCFVHVTKMERPSTDVVQEPKKETGNDMISAPFAFEHLTQSASGSDGHSTSGSLSNMVDSKCTLTSSESVSSGISEDRESSSTGKS